MIPRSGAAGGARLLTVLGYTLDMLYWQCSKGMYFAGSRGTVSRHPTRRPTRVA